MKKRVLAILLTVLLLVSLLPTTALAMPSTPTTVHVTVNADGYIATDGDGNYPEGIRADGVLAGTVYYLAEGSSYTYQFSEEHTVNPVVVNSGSGTILSGSFTRVINSGTITGGTFMSLVTNSGTITGGTFDRLVTNTGTITGGTFKAGILNYGGTVPSGVKHANVGDLAIATEVWGTGTITVQQNGIALVGSIGGAAGQTYEIAYSEKPVGLYVLTEGDPRPSAPFEISDEINAVLGGVMYTFDMPNEAVTILAVFDDYEASATTYTVAVSSSENGSVLADKAAAAAGETVTLTVTPADGYELNLLSVLHGGSNVVTTDKGNGKHTFTMPAGNVTVSATFSLKSTEPATGYDLWVGGEEVTSDKLSGDGWSYEPNTRTLTLTNATINDGISSIASAGDLNIVFVGTNSLNKGIMVGDQETGFYKLTISGTGILNAEKMPYAILAGSITLGDGLQITVPEGGRICEANGAAYIGDSNGVAATSVTLESSTPADTTAPTLSDGSVERTSDTEATVSFTSDEAGLYTCYVKDDSGNLLETTSGESIAGENTITLTGLASEAKVLIIQVTDVPGNPSNMLEFDIPAYVPAPELTAGEVSRTSHTEATVKFTSSQAGQYSYYVVPSGSTDVVGRVTNGTCVAGENTITLTDLNIGAQDISIQVTNAAEKKSDWLKITIPAYEAPTGTFTVVYMTNAGVEMGRVEYDVGGSNAFPAPGQFGTLFADFMARAKQKGSVYLANQPWYTDAAFTTTATFPAGEADQTYTVYCKLTTNLSIDGSVLNRANDVSYSTVYDSAFPASLMVTSYGGPDGRSDVYDGNSPRLVWEKQNTDGTWSEVALSSTTMDGSQTWPNGSFFSGVADNGVYRLKYFVYTAKDNSGAELFHDYAFDPTGGTYTVQINPLELTISGITAVDRPADGTTSVALTGGTLSGVLTQDVGKVSFELGTGTIADADAGENKAVTTNIQLTGEKAANYTLTQPTDLTVNITAAPAATITAVSIGPETATVEKGGTQQFTATVTGTGSFDDTVSWSVSGNVGSGTTINASGLLTVAADETAETIRVIATANGDSSKFASVVVTVTAPAPLSYTITASANNDSLGSVTGGGTYAQGETVTLVATPAAQSAFLHWEENGQVVSRQTSYSFTAEADRSLTAVFTAKVVIVSPTEDQTVTVKEGETATFEITAENANGYEWFVDKNDGNGFVRISGADSDSYTTPLVTTDNDGWIYYCKCINDADTGTNSPAFTLRVTSDEPTVSPVITTTSLPDGTVGTAYSQTLATSAGDITVLWHITQGALPDGLTLSTSGVISGTPTKSGTFRFTVVIFDAAERFSDTQELSITITESSGGNEPGSAPVITSPTTAQNVYAYAGNTATMRITATGASSYQWYVDRGKGYVAIDGANSASYTTSAVFLGNNGYKYYCVAMNEFGTVISPIFTLNVLANSNIPATGDNSNPALWIGLMTIAIAGMGVCTVWMRKRKER